MREYCESMMKKRNVEQFFDDDDGVHDASFLQSQSSALSQRRQKIRGSLHQDTRSLSTEMKERKVKPRQDKKRT